MYSVPVRFTKPDEGRVVFDGRDVTGEPPHRLAWLGTAMPSRWCDLQPAVALTSSTWAASTAGLRP
jgi:ABC-type branched-subunit amino acid transport system ATPase component